MSPIHRDAEENKPEDFREFLGEIKQGMSGHPEENKEGKAMKQDEIQAIKQESNSSKKKRRGSARSPVLKKELLQATAFNPKELASLETPLQAT